MQASARLAKEYKEVAASKDAGISAVMVDSKINHWKGTIKGPVRFHLCMRCAFETQAHARMP
jgi:ubiquitin-protein ligase